MMCHARLSGGQQKTSLEFLMADRGAGVLPVACSLMASFMSAITLLGVTRQTLSQSLMIRCKYTSIEFS